MDAILVINAGSSSVKFQVYGVDRDASLARLVKGQMDGIGARPRLRAESNDKTVLINRQYTRDEVADVAAAIAKTGSWLRQNQKFNLVAVGHRVVHGGPDYDRPVLLIGLCLQFWKDMWASRRCTSRIISRRSARYWRDFQISLRSPALIQLSTVATVRLPIISRFPNNSIWMGFAVTDFTDSRTSMSPIGCSRSRPRWQQSE